MDILCNEDQVIRKQAPQAPALPPGFETRPTA